MKILFLGDEKGLFNNLIRWINENPAHQAIMWQKFYPDGNPSTCLPCPMTDPDIIFNTKNFVTYEDCEKMGITTKPERVYYNLGNQHVSNMLKDWRVSMFNDHFASYNPMHKDYQVFEKADRFVNLKGLPLPFDYSQLSSTDYSVAELKVCQTLSPIAMMGGYSKHTYLIGNACKTNEVDFDLIFDLSREDALVRKALSPVLFDSLSGMMGVTSLEGFSLGQAVLCCVDEPIMEAYEAMLGAKPPVINVSKATLPQVIADLKSGAIDWKAKCLESRVFMETHYTPAKITQLYLDYFVSLLESDNET